MSEEVVTFPFIFSPRINVVCMLFSAIISTGEISWQEMR
jgi:hypothetical protein